MKIKINNALRNFLYNKELFDFTHLDENSIDPSTIAYCLILTFHPKIEIEYKQIRERLNIAITPYNWKANFAYDHLNLSDKKLNQLHNATTKFLQKYNLSENWFVFIEIKIVTGIMIIPDEGNPISFYYPKNLIIDKEELSELDVYVSKNQRLSFPCIVINEHVKPDNINSFIKLHWKDQIEPVLKKLPKRKFSKIDINLFAVGILLFMWRDIEGRSWDKIDEDVELLSENIPNFFSGRNSTLTRDVGSKIIRETKRYFSEIYPL